MKEGDYDGMCATHMPEKHDEVMARRTSEKKERNPPYDKNVQLIQEGGLNLNNDIKAVLDASDFQETTTVIQSLGLKYGSRKWN